MVRSWSHRVFLRLAPPPRRRPLASRTQVMLRWSIAVGYLLLALGRSAATVVGKVKRRSVSVHGPSVRLQLGRRVLAALLLLVAGRKANLGARPSRQSTDLCDLGSAATRHRLDRVLLRQIGRSSGAMPIALCALQPVRFLRGCGSLRSEQREIAAVGRRREQQKSRRQSAFARHRAQRNAEMPRRRATLAEPGQFAGAADTDRFHRDGRNRRLLERAFRARPFALFSATSAAAATLRSLTWLDRVV